MMMSIALRFIPTLMEKPQDYQLRPQGADFDTETFERAKSFIPVLIPCLSACKAEELATAMESRCYRVALAVQNETTCIYRRGR